MFFKTVLFIFAFIPAALAAQIEDSVIVKAADSSKVSFTDSVRSKTDSLLTRTEAVQSYIYYQPFSLQGTFISKTDILRNDYRYAGDLFKVFPFSFERSYGFIGQPNDIYLYAEGSSSTNYFVDGIPISNTLFYTLDFNNVQSEDIDSVEIVPLPRGFLYGFTTNPVSVNFISRDINSFKPYSHIKYYQGPFGEAFIDGIFNMYLFKDLNASVDITNRKVDDSFKNSAFSIWQVKTRLRYNLSNNLNVFGSYYFSKSQTGINGGVNVDAIKQTTQNINSKLFNETLAPVYFDKNSLNFKQHNFGLKILAKPFENSYTNVNVYYKFYQNEFNDVNSTLNSKSMSKDKVLGVLFDQRFSFNPVNLSVQTGYQSLKHNPIITSTDSMVVRYFPDNSTLHYKSFFVSPMLSFTLLDSMFVPSVYFKYADVLQRNSSYGLETEEKFNGFGTDLSIILNENYNFYFGYSRFDDNFFDGEKINTLEFTLSYKNENNKFSAGLFNKKSFATNLWGIGFNGSYLVWKILLEGRLSHYFVEKGTLIEFSNVPETKFTAGAYFKDSLFNSNLDLKTGLVFYYTGKQNLRFLTIPHRGILANDVDSWLTVDFTISAEIQKTAIVYFTWENLFDKQYYITPYYPMLQRNIRFGVAWEIFN
jgi:outer membrane receptor protein involved in Fe transport